MGIQVTYEPTNVDVPQTDRNWLAMLREIGEMHRPLDPFAPAPPPGQPAARKPPQLVSFRWLYGANPQHATKYQYRIRFAARPNGAPPLDQQRDFIQYYSVTPTGAYDADTAGRWIAATTGDPFTIDGADSESIAHQQFRVALLALARAYGLTKVEITFPT